MFKILKRFLQTRLDLVVKFLFESTPIETKSEEHFETTRLFEPTHASKNTKCQPDGIEDELLTRFEMEMSLSAYKRSLSAYIVLTRYSDQFVNWSLTEKLKTGILKIMLASDKEPSEIGMFLSHWLSREGVPKGKSDAITKELMWEYCDQKGLIDTGRCPDQYKTIEEARAELRQALLNASRKPSNQGV